MFVPLWLGVPALVLVLLLIAHNYFLSKRPQQKHIRPLELTWESRRCVHRLP